MNTFRHFMIALLLTLSTSLVVGCSGGEAEYSLEEVTALVSNNDAEEKGEDSIPEITATLDILTEDTMVVEETDDQVTGIIVDSNDNVTYAIVGGADQELFIVDARTGLLSFIETPAYDPNGDNSYEVVIEVSTSTGVSSTLTMIVTVVEDITKAVPLIDFIATHIEAASSTNVITTVEARPADASSTLSYEVTGVDADSFKIDAEGNLYFTEPLPDYGTTPDKTYVVNIVITDGYGNSVTKTMTISLVGDPAEIRPVIITESVDILENTFGMVQIEVSSQGTGVVDSYQLGGTDVAAFGITEEGILYFKEAKDFESSQTLFHITLQVGDNNSNLSDVKNIVVTLQDRDETYNFQNVTDFTPMEGAKAVGKVSAALNKADDNITTTYSMVQGETLLEVDASGNVQFKALAEKGQVITAQVQVQSQYNGSLTLSKIFTVTVIDDPSKIPPSINPTYETLNTVTAPIDTTQAIVTIQASPEGNASLLSYSLSGDDMDKFTIDVNGNLFFAAVYDFYAKNDANADNVYDVYVIVTDEYGNTATTSLIEVTLLEDPDMIAPVITSSTFDLDENSNAPLEVKTQRIGNGVVNQYNIVSVQGCEDGPLFDFENSYLSLKTAKDFETPSSSLSSNAYCVAITVGDDLGNESEVKQIIVNIQDVDETLSFTSLESYAHTENTTAVGTIVATPKLTMTADITYSVAAGSDIFSIDTNSGLLSFKTAPQYDANANNVYTLSVDAQSQYNGSLTRSGTITVTVMPASFEIIFDSDQSSIAMDQNSEVTFPMTATSAASGTVLTYSLEEGYDATVFSIDAETGDLTIKAPSYRFTNETDANIYRAAVVAQDDSGHSARRQGTLTVNAIDGLPDFTSSTTLSIDENSKALAAVTATSPIGSSLSYKIEGGADSAFFSLTSSGALSFNYAPNYEDIQDQNRDNVYEVIVSATDTLYAVNKSEQTLYVTVADVSDAPSNIVFASTSSTSVSVKDGTHVFFIPTNIVSYEVITAISSPSNGILNYSIVSNPDSDIFSINSSGELKIDAPPFSSDQNFALTIRVIEENGESSDQVVNVTILD